MSITVENELTYQLQGAHYGKNDWWDLPNQAYHSRQKAMRNMRWPNDPDDSGDYTGWMWIPDLELRVVRRLRQTITVDVVMCGSNDASRLAGKLRPAPERMSAYLTSPSPAPANLQSTTSAPEPQMKSGNQRSAQVSCVTNPGVT